MTAKHEEPHPCWYCDKPVEVVPHYKGALWYYVECLQDGHHCEGPWRKTRAGAIKAWNERKPQ